MKVAIWSNVHGQSGASSNMLAMAFMGDIIYGRKSILLQTQYSMNHLEYSLVKKEQRKSIEQMQIGMNTLIKSMIAGIGTRELLKSCCLSLGENHIDFVPGPHHKHRNVYEKELEDTLNNILSLAEQCYEYVYIDCGVGLNQYTKLVLQEVDMILVSTCQNKRVLDDLFENYELPHKPICYLIGNYDPKSSNTLKNLFHTYKALNKHNTFVIPYNVEFKDAASEAFLANFFYCNICCTSEDENYYFIQEVQRAVRNVNDILEYLTNNKEENKKLARRVGGDSSVS